MMHFGNGDKPNEMRSNKQITTTTATTTTTGDGRRRLRLPLITERNIHSFNLIVFFRFSVFPSFSSWYQPAVFAI